MVPKFDDEEIIMKKGIEGKVSLTASNCFGQSLVNPITKSWVEDKSEVNLIWNQNGHFVSEQQWKPLFVIKVYKTSYLL